MPSTTLLPENVSATAERMSDDAWTVACLCAAWCDVCKQYRPSFDELAEQHPDKVFLWVDIEDHADIVGDFDVENFPTLLIQRGDDVVFYGTTLPDSHVANRLITSHAEKPDDERASDAQRSADRKLWAEQRNLRKALADAG